jgi:hypothetical protein
VYKEKIVTPFNLISTTSINKQNILQIYDKEASVLYNSVYNFAEMGQAIQFYFHHPNPNTADKEIWNTCASVILQMIAVLEFPPRAGCNILVSLLSRYGTCPLQMKFITKVVMKNR